MKGLHYKKKPKKQKNQKDILEGKLWDIFSVYIRLRDTDKDGFGKCFTCNKIIHWRRGDAGHGIPRQHKATKFNESNNHLQCKNCNGLEGGMREQYERSMDKRYGPGTWNKMLVASKGVTKWNEFLLQNNIDYYTEEVRKLKEAKGMI